MTVYLMIAALCACLALPFLLLVRWAEGRSRE